MIKLTHQQLRMTKFIGSSTLALLLVVIVFSAFRTPEPAVIYKDRAVESPADMARIAQLEKDLADRDKQILAMDTASSRNTGTGSADITRLQRELEAKDKIIRESAIQWKTMLSAKEQELAAALRKPGPPAVTKTVVDNTELNRLKSELKSRDAQIATLRKPNATAVASPANGGADAAELADLQKRNDNLSKGFNTLATQVGMLTKTNNILKQENQGLQAKIKDLQRN